MKRRKLSTARSRADIVSSYSYGTAAPAEAATSPPLPAPAGCSCGIDHPTGAAFCAGCGISLATTVPPAPAPNAPPVADPVDDGGVDNGAVCQTPDCGHLAVEHVNTEGGDNTGQCSIDGCTCQAMTVDTSANPGSAPTDEGGIAAAGVVAEPPPAPAVTEPALPESESGQNAPPPVEGGESMGPEFFIPVAIIEGQATSDGRQIAPEALSWRTPPVPLMGLATETHDPEGWDLNDPAVMCGRIDSFERVPGEGSTQIVQARGFFLPNEDGMYFAELTEAMGRVGVSADVAVHASEIIIGEVDEDGWPTDMSEVLTEGTIMGLTVCPYAAFEGAYIMLGDGTGEDAEPEVTPIPQTADEPAVPDAPPASVTAGGQLIHFMSYDECIPCSQDVDVVVAAGAPTRPPRAWFANPVFQPEDGRLVEILDRRGQRVVGGKYACPITVTDEGRVFGHIAPWDVCHTGHTGQCIIAPHSAANYAHFKRGQHVVTAEGETVRVGVLTLDTGHAPTTGVSPSQAMAHYDNTALAVADVEIGEDDYGIWIAGAMRPDATEEHYRKLRAASISGDWRSMGGRLELVAALAVNQPGFPLAVVAAGQIESLVAAGATMMHRLKNPVQMGESGRDDVLRAALAPMLDDARTRAKDRLASLRA